MAFFQKIDDETHISTIYRGDLSEELQQRRVSATSLSGSTTYRTTSLFVSVQRDVQEVENGRKVVRAQVELVAWASRERLKQPGGKR